MFPREAIRLWIELWPEWIIESNLVRGNSSNHGQVALTNVSRHKRLTEISRHGRRQSEDQRPGSGPVQAMNGKDLLAKLIPDHLQGEFRRATVDITAVNKQPRGFVHNHQLAVLIENG